MLTQTQAYTPALYLPRSEGRYRAYPRQVETPIPGAGYAVDDLAWGEQELNLHGSPDLQHYGDYEMQPLRGTGGLGASSFQLTLPRFNLNMQVPGGSSGGGAPAASSASPPLVPSPSAAPSPTPFLQRKLGPLPYWSVGLLGLTAVGGAAFFVLKRRKKGVSKNRRARRR